MKGYHLRDVHLLLADRNRDIRDSVKGCFLETGFGTVSATDTVADLANWISEGKPDLLIAEIDLADGDLCELFSGVRHHRVGGNPFLLIIAISTSGDLPTVRKVIDTGADDLLVKPISVEILFERITALIRSRKPFVVTSDYIGPTRRKKMRAGPGVPLIEAPNPLQAKALRRGNAATIQRQITAAIGEINEQKMERHADRIMSLVERIVGDEADALDGRGHDGHLAQLLEVAEDLSRRMIDTRFVHISHLCRSLIQVTTALIRAGHNRDPRDVKVLPHLAEAIRAIFTEERDTSVFARDVSESVDRLAAK
ncbi:MAG: response regulator [Alphaproteobacteria bacterium]